MGRVRKTRLIAVLLIVFSLVVYLVNNLIVWNTLHSLETYSGETIKDICTLSTRTAFVTTSGKVYMMGNYYNDLYVSVGLSGFKEKAYNKSSLPVMIFDDNADSIILTAFGGFITQNTNLYVFTKDSTESKTPTFVADDCLVPVNAYKINETDYGCLYINTKNELVFKSITGDLLYKYMQEISDCKYYSNGVYVLLKSDGSLWMIEHSGTDTFLQEEKNIKIADNVKAFEYSALLIGKHDFSDTFVWLSNTNDVYKKLNIDGGKQKIAENAEAIGIYQQNIIVLTKDNRMEAFFEDSKIKMHAEGVVCLSVSDDIVCAYSEKDGLIFWGINKYNAFGCDTDSIKTDIDEAPIKYTRQTNQ